MLRHGADLLKKLEDAGLLKNGELDEEGLKRLKEILSGAEGELAEKLKNNKFVKSLPEPLRKLLEQKRALIDKEEGLIKMRNDSYDELMIIKRRLKEMSDEMDEINAHMLRLRREWEKTFMTWGVPEVGGWVRTMHHEFRQDIWRCFTSNDIEGPELKDLDEEDIFGFGVEKFRHRAILLENMSQLPTEDMLKRMEAEEDAKRAAAARAEDAKRVLAARRLSGAQKFDEEFGALCALIDENYDNQIQVEEFQKIYPSAAEVFDSFSVPSEDGIINKDDFRNLFKLSDGSHDLDKVLKLKSMLQSKIKEEQMNQFVSTNYGVQLDGAGADEEEVKSQVSPEFEAEFTKLCDMVDSNHDKVISLEEFSVVYPIGSAHFFKVLDINKDEVLQKEEFRAMFILADGSGDIERVREMMAELHLESSKNQIYANRFQKYNFRNGPGGTELPNPT